MSVAMFMHQYIRAHCAVHSDTRQWTHIHMRVYVRIRAAPEFVMLMNVIDTDALEIRMKENEMQERIKVNTNSAVSGEARRRKKEKSKKEWASTGPRLRLVLLVATQSRENKWRRAQYAFCMCSEWMSISFVRFAVAVFAEDSSLFDGQWIEKMIFVD